MDAERAVSLIGGCGNRIFIRNMAKALSLHPWLNSPEQSARREAAEWALRHWNAFLAEKQRRLDAKWSRA